MQTLIRRLIAILQIAGGLFGLLPLIEHVIAGGTAFELVSSIIGAVLFVVAIISGVVLLERGRGGVAMAGWVQLLQVPMLNTPWFGYGFRLGASVPLTLTLTTPVHVNIGAHFPLSQWLLNAGHDGATIVGLNLLALLLWLALRLTR